MAQSYEDSIRKAAEAIAGADAMIIGAGAGMGVDSGLPDFRGRDGFWNAYPPYRKLGLDFYALADPRWFRDDPSLAWGFYGHRLNLYRDTQPHDGFAILRRWADRMALGAFAFTSNVDGQFQRAGFDADRIYEVHGAIGHMQCTNHCGHGVFPAHPDEIEINATTMKATGRLPSCPRCNSLARPNILMFGDGSWDSSRSDRQRTELLAWLSTLRGQEVVIVECGAGKAIATVRHACEDLARRFQGTLVRINPRDFDVPENHVSLPHNALDGLVEIQNVLDQMGV